MVMPGWVRPELRADDVHDALVDVAQRVQPDAELRAVAAQRLDLGAARPGRRSACPSRSSGRCGPRSRGSGRAGGPCGRRAAARRTPAGWSPRGRGAGRCRAGRARPSARRTTCSSQTFSASVLPMVLLLTLVLPASPSRWLGDSGATNLRLMTLRRQYRHMDNSSGVGVLDKAALVLGALEAGPATLAGLVAGHRPGPPDRAPARRGARAPPPGRPRHAGPLRPRPAAGRARRGRRRGPAARRRRPGARRACATSPARAPSCSAARATTASASPPPSARSGLRDTIPVGSHADHARRLGRPGAARLGGAGPAAPRPAGRRVHRDHAVRRPPPRLGPERRRARAGRGLGLRAGPRAVRARSSPPCRSPARSSGSPASPAGCTPPAVVAGAEQLTEVLRRAQQANQSA